VVGGIAEYVTAPVAGTTLVFMLAVFSCGQRLQENTANINKPSLFNFLYQLLDIILNFNVSISKQIKTINLIYIKELQRMTFKKPGDILLIMNRLL
jgi:hypothetical protein